MIYKLVSIGNILYKITRDLQLGDEELPIDDFIEWSAEALKLIGAYPQFINKQANITVEDYKAELPCDFMYPIDWFDNNGNRLWFNSSLIGSETLEIQKNQVTNTDIRISSTGVITTSFRNGTIVLQYQAFPVDEDGFPMVPDIEEYKNALFWKIVYQLCIRGHQFRNPQFNDFILVERMWNKHCQRARAEAFMPDADQLEKLKNNWLRFKPDVNQYKRRFYTNGIQQNLKLSGRNNYSNYYLS